LKWKGQSSKLRSKFKVVLFHLLFHFELSASLLPLRICGTL
jgi:hypothetical protein